MSALQYNEEQNLVLVPTLCFARVRNDHPKHNSVPNDQLATSLSHQQHELFAGERSWNLRLWNPRAQLGLDTAGLIDDRPLSAGQLGAGKDLFCVNQDLWQLARTGGGGRGFDP